MPVTQLDVEAYRSIRSLNVPLKRVNIIVGPNGCGKSNLYQSIGLLRHAAVGSLAHALAAEGGMPSILWAGPRKQGPVRVKLSARVDDYAYSIEIGLPTLNDLTIFNLDPKIKSEEISMPTKQGRLRIVERGASTCNLWREDGTKEMYPATLNSAESVMDQISNVRDYPLLDDFRRRLLKWRFYHGFRTDADSAIRQPQVAIRTFALANDGIDLAAALGTILENGDVTELHRAIEDAFPGARLQLCGGPEGLVVGMTFPGIERVMLARELSDGTLRYLCLLAALLSPTPAPLLALNEPETSLNEDLLEPLARLIARSAESSQIWLTTHSARLANALAELTSVVPLRLDKVEGATVRAGRPPGMAYSVEHDT